MKAAHGVPWHDLRERYGPWKKARERLRLWTKDGTWRKMLDGVIIKDGAVGRVGLLGGPVHQHAAGARKGLHQRTNRSPCHHRREPGRSRGGLSTKIHLAGGRSMRFLLTPDQAGDIPTPAAARRISVGRVRQAGPRCRPDVVILDKAHSQPSTRPRNRHGLSQTRRPDHPPHREAPVATRSPAFDTALDMLRYVVKRCFNRLRQFRDLAARHTKRTASYQAASPSRPSSSGPDDLQDGS